MRNGILHHENKRNKCAFYGNSLDDALYSKLKAHFNKESELLRDDINHTIASLEKEAHIVSTYFTIDKNLFYYYLHLRVDDVIKEWDLSFKKYAQSIDPLINTLKKKLENIFDIQTCPDIEDTSHHLQEQINRINELIAENNNKAKTLPKDQENLRKKCGCLKLRNL